MFFIPYRIDSRKSGLSILTVLICIVCRFIYWQQYSIDSKYYQSLERFCNQDLSKREISWINKVPTQSKSSHCQYVLETLREADDSSTEILRFSKQVIPVRLFTSKQKYLDYVEKQLGDIFRKSLQTEAAVSY